MGAVVKNPSPLPMQETEETQVPSLSQEDSLEEEMVTHFSILAWEIPWTEEPRGATVPGVTRVGHDLVTKQQQGEGGYMFMIGHFR